ncbi:MAG: peptidoglycan bridge formation glycyltransferase FemA/FemB family protein [Patescibacteria group bacterium]
MMNSADLDKFVKCHPAGSFFQSLAFGEFQAQIPYRGKFWPVLAQNQESRIKSHENLMAGALIIKVKLPLNFCWLWIPYGPLGGFHKEIFEELARIAQKEKALFVRVEPPSDWTDEDAQKVKKIWHIKKSKTRWTAEHSLILDLQKSEQEILAQMKPKGRYNINIAKKHGVSVHQFNSFNEIPPEDFETFYGLLQKTAWRDGFQIHPKYFYEKLLQMSDGQMTSLFLAYSQADEFGKKEVIGGIIVVYYKDTATYYFGASDHTKRHLMAPYLLQWEAIREAKRRGMQWYDFLGIAPPGDPHHPWAGITDFKKKFGGKEVAYAASFEVIYNQFLYRFLDGIKKILTKVKKLI